MTDTRTPDRSVSRRTLAKGAAWSVPTVALAATAPALANSIQVPPRFKFEGACKSPGSSCKSFPKGYKFTFTICNDSPVDIYIQTVAYAVSGTNLDLTDQTSKPILVKANQCEVVVFTADGSNSGNQVFTVNMTVGWNHSPSPTGDPDTHTPAVFSFTVPGTPPDCACPGGLTSVAPTSTSSSSTSSSSSSATSSAPASSTSAPSSSAPASTSAPAPTSAPAAPASQAPTSTAAPSGS